MLKTIQRMLLWCAPFKKRLYLGFFVSFIHSFFVAIPIILAGYAMNLMLEHMHGKLTISTTHFMTLFAGLIVSVLGRYGCTYLRAVLQDMIAYEITAEKRLTIGRKMKQVPLSFFKKNDKGMLTSAISTDLGFIEMHSIKMLDTIINGYLSLLAFMIVLAFYHWQVIFIAIIGTLLSLYFLNQIGVKARENASEFQRARDMMTAATLEFIRGMAIVKSFKLQGLASTSLKESFEKAKKINIKIEKDFVVPNQIHLAVLKVTTIAIIIAVSLLCYNHQMAIPEMVVFIVFAFTMFRGVEAMNDAMHILKVLDETFDKLDSLEAVAAMDETGKTISLNNYDIEFKHVSFRYDDTPVLTNVDFLIPQQQTTAIVGPSGSGKSTICHLIARFYDVQQGEIFIGHQPIKDMTTDSLLSHISIVFQNVYLFNDTIMNNIRFGKPDATEEEVYEAARKAQCHQFIMNLPDGYHTQVGEAGATLSGGEKQRISIARSIVKDAPIVILDEATASMDPENEHLIQEAINELVAGKTLIIIAHRLKTIEQADQILVLDNGKLVQKGTHQELIKEIGTYKKLMDCRKEMEAWTL